MSIEQAAGTAPGCPHACHDVGHVEKFALLIGVVYPASLFAPLPAEVIAIMAPLSAANQAVCHMDAEVLFGEVLI